MALRCSLRFVIVVGGRTQNDEPRPGADASLTGQSEDRRAGIPQHNPSKLGGSGEDSKQLALVHLGWREKRRPLEDGDPTGAA